MSQKSFWHDLPYRPRSKLTRNIRADVAIVGGGIMGVSAAYHLAKAGFSCALVEKEVIASGPAGKNVGMVVEGTSFDLLQMIQMIGSKYPTEIWKYTRQAQKHAAELIKKENIVCDVEKTGSLFVALDKEQASWLKREAATRRKYGFTAKLLGKRELSKAISSPFEAALYNKNDFLLHPVKFVRGLARCAEKQGARIYEHTPALGWNEHEVRTPGGKIAADKVLVAIETETPFISSHRKCAQVIATKPLKNPEKLGWKYGHMLWESVPHYNVIRFSHNRLMITKDIIRNATEQQKKAHARQLQKTLLKYFPILTKNDVAISHRWDCLVMHTPRNIFSISHEKGVYYAYGCSGNGLTNGTFAGKLVADHFSGKKLPEIYVPSSKISLAGCSW